MAVIRSLSLEDAQAWFSAMPRDQRLRSLAPDFARADLAREPGLRCLHIGYEDSGHRWLHTVHLREVAGYGHAAISPYGYGGPLCDTEDRLFVEGAWSAWQQWAREENVIGEFCRFHPEAGHQRFWLGDVQLNRVTVSAELLVEPVERQYNTLARRKIRKTSDVPVRWSRDPADAARFGAFYRAAMLAIGAHDKYLFSDDYFRALLLLAGAEVCICGDDAQWLSAGLYLFQQAQSGDVGAGGTLEYHLGCSSPEGHSLGTAYLLQHVAAMEGQRRQLLNFYLGGGTTPDLNNSLLFYKRAFSRRLRNFFVGNALHHEALYDKFILARGYHRANAPANLLFN